VPQGELVPAGKARDGLALEHALRAYTKLPSGGWVPSGWVAGPAEEAERAAAEAAVVACTARLEAARAAVAAAAAAGPPCVRGTLVLADLAGADYDEGAAARQPAAQRREATEINKSLLALKQCVRGLADGSGVAAAGGGGGGGGGPPARHQPFRDAKLTHLLKRHLLARECRAVLVANVGPAGRDVGKTVNTLQYAALMAGGAPR
jgi:hypothetical protein